MRRTKIVCTLGPASESPLVLRQMLRAGMNVARLNFSHGTHENHASRLATLRALAAEEGLSIAVLADLQGPKLRIGEIAAGQAVLRAGATLTLTLRNVPGDERELHLPHPELLRALQPGHSVLLDDGVLELRVQERTQAGDVLCEVIAGGTLTPHKGVSVPRVDLDIPSLTEKDRRDLAFALTQEVDYIALSFVRRAGDVAELRQLLQDSQASVPIIAKIEKPEALDDLPAILELADGIMVARGDLGVEMPPEEVPLQQKRLIKLARSAAKPVITATQMLESMIGHPRPTRAEASDVANAILDGTDAIMLSAETAMGHYPIEAVKMMDRIALVTEQALPYTDELLHGVLERSHNPTDAISQATCEIAFELEACAIVPSTMSGYTARMISRHRPATSILVVTPSEQVRRRMALIWGVQTIQVDDYHTTEEMLATADRAVQAAGLAQPGDLVVITAGIPITGQGMTNMVKVHTVGHA